MEHKEKIKELIKEGKINSDQAIILLRSLKDSETRRDRIFKQVLEQKHQREKNAWGFLNIGAICFLMAITISIFMGNSRGLSRDNNKAIADLNQAAIYLVDNNTEQAIVYCKKAIRKSSSLPLAHALLGTAYKMAYQKTGKEEMSVLSEESINKASLLAEQQGGVKMSGVGLFFMGVFVLLILGTISVIMLAFYNILANREEKVNMSWAQVGVLYQRKLDLIPVLLEVVREYAKHEKATLQGVIQARNSAQNFIEQISGIAESGKEKIKELINSQQEIGSGLSKISALAETYPQLKADKQYLAMHEQIEQTEDLIIKARQKYNKVVKGYNAGLKLFPMNLISLFLKFQPKKYINSTNNLAN